MLQFLISKSIGDNNSNNDDGGLRVVVGPKRVVLIGLCFFFVVFVIVFVIVFVLVIVAILIGIDCGVVKGILVVVVPPKTTTVGRGASLTLPS
jgi:hypothetical protein